jgi:DNA-binding transcriptional LysR family regulator
MDQSLLVFIAVVEHQSFTRAAETLHMTQPAVSNYIQTLERTMGTKLLDRTNKYVQLNKAGEVVYHHAKEIMSLYTRMQNLIDDLNHTASGSLTIGSSYTFGEYLLPHMIGSLRKTYPLINPNIIIGNSTEMINLMTRHQLDVGIIEGDFHSSHVTITPFATDQMEIACLASHPLAEKKVVLPMELEDETWIVREEGSGTREMQEKAFEKLGFYPKRLMVFGSTQVIKESIEAGLGIALLSKWTIRKELQFNTLKALRVKDFPLARHFSLIHPDPQFQTKATQVFIEVLKTHEILTGNPSV